MRPGAQLMRGLAFVDGELLQLGQLRWALGRVGRGTRSGEPWWFPLRLRGGA